MANHFVMCWREPLVKNAIIVDLDGTLCDTTHRQHFLKQQPKNWKAFFDGCVSDPPHQHVLRLCQALIHEFAVIYVSGRPSSHRAQTEQWLARHGLNPSPLFMRKEGDYRPDTEIKKEILDWLRLQDYSIIMAIDDRPSVIKMWRENGVPCLAVDQSSWFDHPKEREYILPSLQELT